ncbi:MAG: sigma-70 family RNA polymerase sigma factor [Emcibacter sp.]|nr:sigma-70 family RNA polymerase sigma factor [Emcibacter sp.]
MKQRLKLISTNKAASQTGGRNNDHGGSNSENNHDKKTALLHKEITAVYKDYNDSLVRYLTIRLRCRTDAVDVAQEAYIRLIRRDNMDEIDCIKSFLFRTATNISIDLQRQRARHVKNFSKSTMLFGKIDEITPERTLNAQQTLVTLKKAVEDLSPKCREAFIMYKFKNMELVDIAKKMGLSVSSIRKYIARALAFCIREIE